MPRRGALALALALACARTPTAHPADSDSRASAPPAPEPAPSLSAPAPEAPEQPLLTTPYRPGDPCWGSTDETLLLALVERARAEGREHALRYRREECAEVLGAEHPKADRTYPRFIFTEAPRRDALCQTLEYRPTAVALVTPSGSARWCVPLPEGFISRGVGRVAVENHLTSPAAFSPIAAHVRDQALVLRAGATLLILSGTEGHTVLSHAGAAGKDRFVADGSAWEVRAGGETCRGEGGRTLLTVCGGHIVSFDGGTLVVATTEPHRVVGESVLDLARHALPPAPGASSATTRIRVRAGGLTLTLVGTLTM